MSLKVNRRTTDVYLYTSEDQEQIADLALVVERALTTEGPRRVTDGDAAKTAAEAYDAFVVEAADRAVKIKLTALAGKAWRTLLAEHPPRPDVKGEGDEVLEAFIEDRLAGFNVDTMAQPLVLGCIDSDQFDNADDLEEFVDELSDPDFSRVFSAAVRLNTEAGPDPKFRASSWLDQRFAVMSRLESASASLPPTSTS